MERPRVRMESKLCQGLGFPASNSGSPLTSAFLWKPQILLIFHKEKIFRKVKIIVDYICNSHVFIFIL